ncbi:MAG: hypothetical protein CVV64_00330 [Candidatus Wallbacteria bacterium HGW-Wallbacteria-1]|jgi:AcrR family transcriptional regulator|uniref:HTH tetR-type domain-containing protein n=1 Tax=Candidatus Wallbacteria bacterium HGW-Wallbacteria-1 TaxID=2013854 RepID=A0A2N1PU89_9BACT|nr:MAG: hypothetical protein CVV64_00330 [Candidatus Wallbacteria bacterium HGW-Wallbacteria-1]
MKSVNPPLPGIEEAAVQVFGELGLEGATARKVAARFNGAAGSIYYYYKSMVDMYTKVMGSRFEKAWSILWQPVLNATTDHELVNALNSWISRFVILDNGQKAALKTSFVETLGMGRDNPLRMIVRNTRTETMKSLSAVISSKLKISDQVILENTTRQVWASLMEMTIQGLEDNPMRKKQASWPPLPRAVALDAATINIEKNTALSAVLPENPIQGRPRKLAEELL